MFPSIYFGGLFPYLTYIRRETREPLRGPLTDYHDRRIIASYSLGYDTSKCAEVLGRRDVAGCRLHFDAAFAESSSREANLPIKVMDYVGENFSIYRTFHTFNHPANGVMWHVVSQFLALIGVPMIVDRPPVNQFLDGLSAAIPPEMEDAVGLRFIDDEYRLSGKAVSHSALIEDFYRSYDQITDFPALCRYNSIMSPA